MSHSKLAANGSVLLLMCQLRLDPKQNPKDHNRDRQQLYIPDPLLNSPGGPQPNIKVMGTPKDYSLYSNDINVMSTFDFVVKVVPGHIVQCTLN